MSDDQLIRAIGRFTEATSYEAGPARGKLAPETEERLYDALARRTTRAKLVILGNVLTLLRACGIPSVWGGWCSSTPMVCKWTARRLLQPRPDAARCSARRPRERRRHAAADPAGHAGGALSVLRGAPGSPRALRAQSRWTFRRR